MTSDNIILTSINIDLQPRFCRGCKLECNDEKFNFKSAYLAIDWDPTALHLRYQSSQEKVK